MLNGELSARRFTSSAIHIVDQILARACDRGISIEYTDAIVAMLALWSLLRWERKVGLVALERAGIEIDALARDVDEGLREICDERHPGASPLTVRTFPSGQRGRIIDFHTPLAPLLARAEHEAHELGHAWVGSEHLLLAIIGTAGPELRRLLDRHNVKYDQIRMAVVALLRSE